MQNEGDDSSPKRLRTCKRATSLRITNPEYRYYDETERGFYNKMDEGEKLMVASLETMIKSMNNDDVPIRFKILLSNIDAHIKAIAIKKLRYMYDMDESSSEYYKIGHWIDSLCKLPIGNYADLPVGNTSPISEIRTFVQNVKHTLDTTVYGHTEAKDQIVRLIAQWITNPESKGLVIGIGGFKGCGKCLAWGTEVLMADGQIKAVQDVEVGEYLMGDDSRPRKVLALGTGVGYMYRVTHATGQSYVVNGDHILVLRYQASVIEEITINDFLRKSPEEQLKYEGMCAIIQTFPMYKKTKTSTSSLRSPYDEGFRLGNCFRLGNPESESIRIPPDIMYGAMDVRQSFARGVLAANPHLLYHDRVHPTNKHFVSDLTFVFRSIGFVVSPTVHNEVDGLKKLIIDKRKYAQIEVVHLGQDHYYGFMLDGNERFVLGNFVVTHNTSLVKNGICKALGLPFAFIALGGASDGSYLDGHSYTYEGSTWGKVVDILMKAKCMNPVMYFDELDKVSYTYKGEEIINILIHLTDSSQNDKYQDKYFTDVEFDISRSLVIFSYNDESSINPILKDRMVRIQTEGYKMEEKVVIAQKYLIPELLNEFKFRREDVQFTDEIIKFIIQNRIEEEEGVRNLKRAIEAILSNINLNVLLTPERVDLPVKVTETMIQKYLKHPDTKQHGHKMMNVMYS
jgi:hypothetical protein